MFVAVARIAAAAGIVIGAVVYSPATIGEAGPSPRDASKEDLTRIEYPSQKNIAWEPKFIRPSNTVESLFGRNWETVARFNRIDRRHVYPGMTLKVPVDLEKARTYTPLPSYYEPAR